MVLLTLKFANTFKVRRGCLQGHSPRPWVVAHADEPNQGETEIAHAKHGQPPPSETIKTKRHAFIHFPCLSHCLSPCNQFNFIIQIKIVLT